MKQNVYKGVNAHTQVKNILYEIGAKRVLLVCGDSFDKLEIKDFLESVKVEIVQFRNFSSNPLYKDVCEGVDLFNKKCCDTILTIGGGSAIDVGKCIKLFSKMDPSANYLQQAGFDTQIPLIALPTTAGTGSESTCFAVIYFEGKKQSVIHSSIQPDYVILDPTVLKNLPIYQKKCTMMDALCQGIEAWWSVKSTRESKEYSQKAVRIIVENWRSYIFGENHEIAEKMMVAANYAGHAINIAQTTAAHAMSYKITSMYKIPHGHAVAICLPEIWEYMIYRNGSCLCLEEKTAISKVFFDIAKEMNCENATEAIKWFRRILVELRLDYPRAVNKEKEILILTAEVNEARLRNNPIALDKKELCDLYGRIIK